MFRLVDRQGRCRVKPFTCPQDQPRVPPHSEDLLNKLFSLLLLLFAMSGVAPAGDFARTEQVRISLLPEHAAAVPGTTLWLGLRFELIPHWHVYWRNPGDSGEAPRVDWQLPDGWQAGDIQWPTPQRIPVGPLVNYGYEDAVTLLIPVTVPADQKAREPAGIAANVSWLVCREECIPQDARLEVTLPVMPAGADPATTNPFDAVRAQWPVAAPGDAGYLPGPDALTMRVDATGWADASINSMWFAANDWGPIAPSQPQVWRFDGDALIVTLPVDEAPLAGGAMLDRRLVVSEAGSYGPLTQSPMSMFRLPCNCSENVRPWNI